MGGYVTIFLHLWGGATVTRHDAEGLRRYAAEMGVCRESLLHFLAESRPGEHAMMPQQYGCEPYLIVVNATTTTALE